MRRVTAALCVPAGMAMLLTSSCARPLDHASSAGAPLTSASVRQLGEPAYVRAVGPVSPDPRVGALFLDGKAVHFCTASVLHSTTGDLVLTAAHCLQGGSRVTFVPAFQNDAAPSDRWTVQQVYLDPRWVSSRDPRADYAIARVRGPGESALEERTGAALILSTAPPPGSLVTVTGYPAGVGGQPIACQGSTRTTDDGFPSLQCQGLVGGTSGAPWVSGSRVTGVIGGFEAGGCTADVSYSAPFDEHAAQLLARAEAGGPGDTAPSSLDDGC
ncbi:trypsin [Mycobacterium intermedium]|uniref:Trypsin n=1 Tax=Mycobacterium intermedium TaxID=28445 RepID=A0A1E3S9C1_MYCIE|nr:serine protease [Mycobacterium intermedium]MCV6965900.1 trypsin-like peptidase domain-containing protein [Mycobacterium intermedium]ODQ98671.1 trypsin [Mycobacterium intermedium]OPE45915.1 trypsin [Mycobacterium intermedium]ORB10098.1 trypsin [Mycobacterium intermedium]